MDLLTTRSSPHFLKMSAVGYVTVSFGERGTESLAAGANPYVVDKVPGIEKEKRDGNKAYRPSHAQVDVDMKG